MELTTALLIGTGMVLAFLAVLRVTAVMSAPKAEAKADESRKLRKERAEAEAVLAEIRSERGRTMNMMRNAKKRFESYLEEPDEEPDDDDDDPTPLDRLLDHPAAEAIAKRAGVDIEKVRSGDADELARVEKLLGNITPKNGDSAATEQENLI